AVGAGKHQQPESAALLPTQDDVIAGFSASTALAVNDLATVVTGTDPLHGALTAVTGSEEIASGIRMGLDVLTMLTPGSGAANAASHADDVLRVAAGAASHADDVARVAGSVATHVDDAARLASSAAGRADDAARYADDAVVATLLQD
ncbi:MAG: hypothetical protein LBK67_04380, partial [Coriobacteriales bacterium]|nr:hypothetical protein [Coriobacteriales bacterium]